MLDVKLDDYRNRLKTDFQKEFTESRPFTRNSFLGSILDTVGASFYTMGNMLKYVIKQIFANTAEHEHVRLQAQNRIDVILPSRAFGNVGVSTTEPLLTVPIGTLLVDLVTQREYETTDLGVVVVDNEVVGITKIIGDKGLVSVSTDTPHELIDSTVTVVNGTHLGLNGTYTITVTGAYSFTYEITTGEVINEDMTNTSITIVSNKMVIPIRATVEGVDGNLKPLSTLTFSTGIPSVDLVQVIHNGVSGGRDVETAEEYRVRFLTYLRMPQSYFNHHQLKAQILSRFPKATRVYIEDNTPLVHSIRLNVMDDSAPNKELDQTELDLIKVYVMDVAPVNTILEAIEVRNVVQQVVELTVTNIQPPINSLKEVVKADLESYFKELPLGKDILVKELYGVIYSAIDYIGNVSVKSFNIDISVDIPINTGELAVLDCEVK